MRNEIEKIIYISYDANKKEVCIINEDNRNYCISRHIKSVLNALCISQGSSMEGRLYFFSKTQKIRKKVPLLVSEKHEVIFFPIYHKRAMNQLWIAYQPIKAVKSKEQQCEIIFKNNTSIEVEVNERSVKRQMARCKSMIKFLHKI